MNTLEPRKSQREDRYFGENPPALGSHYQLFWCTRSGLLLHTALSRSLLLSLDSATAAVVLRDDKREKRVHVKKKSVSAHECQRSGGRRATVENSRNSMVGFAATAEPTRPGRQAESFGDAREEREEARGVASRADKNIVDLESDSRCAAMTNRVGPASATPEND